MTVIGIVCPKCHGFTTETHSHPLGFPAFVCKRCQLILEPPNGMREFTATTPLEKLATDTNVFPDYRERATITQ